MRKNKEKYTLIKLNSKFGINDFMRELSRVDDERIVKYRIAIENLNLNKSAICVKSNPRLYALKQPNKEENLQRIKAALCELELWKVQLVLSSLEGTANPI